MAFCSFAQIIIPISIMYEISEVDSTWKAEWHVNIVRFFCLGALHYGLTNDIDNALKCMKYLILHNDDFKYDIRAFFACQLQIVTVLLIEVLSIKYIMMHDTVLNVIGNFIKLKIIATFDDFFINPYKNTALGKLIGVNFKIDRFRKQRVYVSIKDIEDG